MTGTAEKDSMDNWKQFQGTELGGLMSQLYGAQNRPKVNYPKPKVKAPFLPEKGFIPGGASAEAVDPRKCSVKRDVKIAKPTFGKKSADQIIHPVDTLARRRSESVIKAELDDIKMRQNHYRPAFRQAISSDQEKDRLSQICTFKGGKALPSEFVLPIQEAPFEIEEKRRLEELQSRHKAKKYGAHVTKKVLPTEISPSEQLAMQITKEIDERREYLEEMRNLGICAEKEGKIKAEISQRLLELKRLDL